MLLGGVSMPANESTPSPVSPMAATPLAAGATAEPPVSATIAATTVAASTIAARGEDRAAAAHQPRGNA